MTVAHLMTDEAELAQVGILMDNDHAVACGPVIDAEVVDRQHVVEPSKVNPARSRRVTPPLHKGAPSGRKRQPGDLAGRMIHLEPSKHLRVREIEIIQGDSPPIVTHATTPVPNE